MPKFRKKPVVIEAIKWTGHNLREIIDFTGLNPSAEKWTWPEYEQVVKDEGLKIFTLEGPHLALVGDMTTMIYTHCTQANKYVKSPLDKMAA